MKKYLAVAIALAWIVTGCSSSGTTSSSSSGTGTSSTDVTGLEIAQQMSLVTAQDSTVSSSRSALTLGSLLKKLTIPASGDYVDDIAEYYVYDESMKTMDIINEILCLVDQTGYAEPTLLNQGDYNALINEEACSTRQGDHSSDSNDQSSAGTNQASYTTWVLNSSRASNDSPQVVHFWLPFEDGGDNFDEIRGELVVTAAKDDTHPFGEFTMDMVGYSAGTQAMTIRLTSTTTDDGRVEFQMKINEGEGGQEVHALLDSTGNTGAAYATHTEHHGGETGTESVQVAFDADHYHTLIGDGTTDATACLDRNNFINNVWNYNLYETNGNRKELNGGFGIKKGNSFGFAGYYGVFLPPEETVTSGDQVTSDDGATTYTIFQGPGRLIRRTRHTLTLHEITNDLFQTWDPDTNGSIQVKWNGTNFVKIGLENCSPETGCTFTALPSPVVLTFQPYEFFGMWKQGLGNINAVADENGLFTDDMEVPYYSEDFVTPTDDVFANGAVSLKCTNRCLKAALTADDLDTDPFLPDINDSSEEDHYTYTIDPSDFTLERNGQAVKLADGETPSEFGPYSWGVRSGSMVLSSVILAHPWEIYDQDVTYEWETGPHVWNRYTALLDSENQAVTFDQPLSCLYQSDADGTFVLDYSGPGNLHGIPFEKIENEESGFQHWVAVFTIPDGTELNCGGTTYVTKAMSVEQNMQQVDESECAGAPLQDVSPPDVTFHNPNLDAAPTVTSAPAVIEGELQ